MSEVAKHHNYEFDPVRNDAYNFAVIQLGLTTAPLENIALVRPDQITQLKAYYGEGWGGGYNPGNNTVIVAQYPHYVGQNTAHTYNAAAAIHEIAHTATGNTDEHIFYNEALSGVAEYKYIEWLRSHGNRKAAAGFLLKRAGVELWVPSNWRYLDAHDADNAESKAYASQGLLAALGIAHSMPASNLTSNQLMAISQRNGSRQFETMRQSLNALTPGLAKYVESLPETTNGVIQAAAIVQEQAIKKGLL